MRNGTDLPRIVRKRRQSAARIGRRLRPAGWILLLIAGAACAAGAAMVFSPLPISGAELGLGSRPEGAQFFDRTGRLITEAGSSRAAESRWYGLDSAPAADCILPAFLAARGLTEEDLRSSGLLDVPRAVLGTLFGTDDLAGEAASELLAMHGSGDGLWDRVRLAGAVAARSGRMHTAEWILNTGLYGRGTVGVDSAALTYFDVPAGEMTVAQCAALEALAENPDLAMHTAGWKDARDALLDRMLGAGYLGQAERDQAVAQRLPAAEPSDPDAGSIFGGMPILDSFLSLAVDRLSERYPREELPRSGIRVFTTLDLDFEFQLLCAAQNVLSPPAQSAAAVPTLEGKPCDLAALLGPESQSNPPADLALAVIDPASGEVLAYFDSARGEAKIDRGEAGAALLPFVYLSAFTRGFSPASMLFDIPRVDLAEQDASEYLGPLSARAALQNRALAASAGMFDRVGGDHIARILSLLGLASEREAQLSFEDRLVQGAELLPLTRAYATLAAGGLETADLQSGDATVILRVEDNGGSGLAEFEGRQTRRIFGSDLAYLVQDILAEKTARAELAAPALAGSRSSVAAALAEDAGSEGAWAFAFTPAFAVGVRSRNSTTEASTSISSWTLAQAAAGWALRSLPVQSWQEPPGIVRTDVCVPSGLLPSRYCPNVSSEIFLAGNEPTQLDSFYRPVAVDRESGRLATLWTPLALVEEKVFFTLDGDARTWAERSGFPLPPDTYDTLPDSFPYFPELHMDSPAALSIVRGKIVFRGTASAAGMERYLVQAGPGLYPSVWFTLGSGKGPVTEGSLAEWDASEAGGLWSVQLTAVLSDGKIQTVAIPLTIDNTPPFIRWIVPGAPKPISMPVGEALILQVDVTDNLEVQSVRFYLDGKIRTLLEVGPFSIRWPDLTLGRHSVRVCAQDRAGNETCTQELEVKAGL